VSSYSYIFVTIIVDSATFYIRPIKRRWTCDQQVTGSNPSRPAVECNPGQVVITRAPLSPSSIIWYQPVGSDALWLGR